MESNIEETIRAYQLCCSIHFYFTLLRRHKGCVCFMSNVAPLGVEYSGQSGQQGCSAPETSTHQYLKNKHEKEPSVSAIMRIKSSLRWCFNIDHIDTTIEPQNKMQSWWCRYFGDGSSNMTLGSERFRVTFYTYK